MSLKFASKLLPIAFGAMGLLSICACTTRSMYEESREDTRRACLNQPPSIDRDRCLERNSHSFDEYTRERERVRQEEDAK